MKKAIVIGGGIAGLSAAWRLQQAAPGIEIMMIERDGQLGGKIRTERTEGFVLDCGPDSFLSRKTSGVALCEEVGVADRLVGQTPRAARSFIAHEHRLYPIPEGFSGLVPTDLDALIASELLTEQARHRILQEPSIPPAASGHDETIAQFFSRRFGPELFALLIEPLLSGIFAGEASALSLDATYPQLREMERRYGSLLKALESSRPAQRADSARSQSYPPFVSFREGLDFLVHAIVSRLNRVKVVLGAAVGSVEPSGRRYRVVLGSGERLEADAVILATPAHESARLLARVDADLGDLHAAIPFSSTIVIYLAFDARDLGHELDGYGYVIPQVEDSELLACSWSSSKWVGRAPEGKVLVRLFAGRFGREEVIEKNDAELLRIAAAELSQTLRVSARPLLSRLYRHRNAMPQYTLGHSKRLAAIEERLAAHGGLFLAGASYRGVGIPDCIDSGARAARAAVEYLKGVRDET